MKFLLLLFCYVYSLNCYCQQDKVDSLKTILTRKEIGEYDKIIAFANLIDVCNSFSSRDSDLLEAIEHTKQQEEPEYKALGYAYLSIYYARNDSITQAYDAIDNCTYYIDKIPNSHVDIKTIALLKTLKAKLMLNDNLEVLQKLFDSYNIYKNEQNLEILAEIYHMFYIYYFSIGDSEKTKMYAELCLNIAEKSKNNELICRAWHAYGASLRLIERQYLNSNPSPTRDKLLKDSALYALNQSIHIYEQYKKDIPPQTYMLTLANIANHYAMDKDDEGKYLLPDSILYYADKALEASIQ